MSATKIILLIILAPLVASSAWAWLTSSTTRDPRPQRRRGGGRR